MAGHQPFLYEPMGRHDDRFPQPAFDPKVITRASFEPRKARPRHNGPLVSFNRHPDAHMVLTHRSNDYQSLSPRIKTLIKSLRVVQLILRALQLLGAAGILTLFILMTNVATAATWILRIAPGVAMLHCSYGMYHMARPAGGRTPASSAAYQVFAGISDVCLLPIYAFGFYVVRGQGAAWSNRMSNPGLMEYFLPAAEYAALGCGISHVITLCLSIWLGIMFRKIALMPPDMNPLEDRFTTRAKHKRNKSSIATTATQESEKRLSTPSSNFRQAGTPYSNVSCPPTIPFLRTRTNSGGSHLSRSSRVDLPSRHYQIIPGNASPRNSVVSTEPRPSVALSQLNRNSYTPLTPISPAETSESTPGLALADGFEHEPSIEFCRRPAKFTETWCATDSLISRTQHRNRMLLAAGERQSHSDRSHAYEAIGGRNKTHDDASDSELDDDSATRDKIGKDSTAALHPQPLRSHPPRPETRFCLGLKNESASRSYDARLGPTVYDLSDTLHEQSHARHGFIEHGTGFFSKPYGELKPATPPVVVGNGRHVSSGNDFAQPSPSTMGRRNVSGKIAEEGRAAYGYQRYSAVNV